MPVWLTALIPKRQPVMNKISLLVLLAVLAFPVWAYGQTQDADTVSLEANIQQLNALCPCGMGDYWNITSVVTSGDTVILEIETPASLASFLPMLTVNKENAKRLWLDLVMQYGKDWADLVKRLPMEKRFFLLALKPKDGENISRLLITPDEIGTILAKL